MSGKTGNLGEMVKIGKEKSKVPRRTTIEPIMTYFSTFESNHSQIKFEDAH